MSCNGWNHGPGCTCGWGGDTGGGGAGAVHHLRPADGRIWSSAGLGAESFTTPNARCPVCGESVFFYQSSAGGRVFFDELGPPWPKHPCTDKPAARRPGQERWHTVSDGVVLAPGAPPAKTASASAGVPQLLERHAPRAWRPLVACGPVSSTVLFTWTPVATPPAGRVSVLPIRRQMTDAPVYWRWSETPGMVEIETIEFGDGLDLKKVSAEIPGWIGAYDERPTIASLDEIGGPSAKRWNELGWLFSFAQASGERSGSIFNLARVCGWMDFDLARACFERAAEAGFWAGQNNLGVLCENGYGMEPDLEAAFAWFEKAAGSFEDVPLAHLARCYREGIGCDPDLETAEMIEELRRMEGEDAAEEGA